MPNVTLAADLDVGALIEIAVGLSVPQVKVMKAAGLPHPFPEIVRARIDTGTRLTVIDRTLVSLLALPRSGEVELHTVSTGGQPIVHPVYEVALHLAQPRLRPVSEALRVLSADLRGIGVKALLGRDVLSRCVFIYNGPAGQFTLAI